MLPLLGLLPAQDNSAFIERLDKLAIARQVDGMAIATGLSADLFKFLTIPGVYGVGAKGWRALPLAEPQGSRTWVVFSTPLTVQDRGEQLFLASNNRLVRRVSELDDLGFSVVRHQFDVRFDVPAKQATIADRVTLKRSDRSGPTVIMRLAPSFRVSKVTDQKARLVPFSQAGGVIAIAAPKEARFTIRLLYRGKVDELGYAAAILPNEASLTNTYWWPSIARQPAPYVATVRSPRGWTAIAQGELVSAEDEATERVTKFKMNLPTSYFSVSAAPYRSFETTVDGLTVAAYSVDMSLSELRWQVALTSPVVSFYNKLFPWPFKRWVALDSAAYRGGALEAYSFATYGHGWLPDLDAHEPAHTFWGGVIPNTYLRSLWNESFASFFEDFYEREGAPGNRDERRLAFVSDAQDFAALVSCAQGSAEAGPIAGALGYGKGAAVLQMLERYVGTPVFTQAMREWLRTHKRGAAGEWEDFETVLIGLSDKNVKGFFDSWIRGTAHLKISPQLTYSEGRLEGRLTFDTRMEIPLEALIESADGSRAYVSLDLRPDPSDPKVSTFTLPWPSRPALVSLDPWRRLARSRDRADDPPQISSFLRRASVWSSEDGLKLGEQLLDERFTRARIAAWPASLDKVLIVGNPVNEPRIAELLARVGISVRGNGLEYKGTQVDLTKGGVLALIDLPGGGRCAVAAGSTDLPPAVGRARLAVFDGLGRFVRGETDPVTTGPLAVKL